MPALIEDLYQALADRIAQLDLGGLWSGFLPDTGPGAEMLLAGYLIGLFLLAVPPVFVTLNMARWRSTGRAAFRMLPLALVMMVGLGLAAGSEMWRHAVTPETYLHTYAVRVKLGLIFAAAGAAALSFWLGSLRLTVRWPNLSRLGHALSLICWLNVLFAARLTGPLV
ncbi:hypothetical protein GCM10011316_06660 [Roseibium aquae]|uniref:Uncharacterized protein n=1 Tax=Roseibium aquae TaxID=1323746 RepID=A0A916TB69_9HYPH|nr:hypothetical protein [Roseibium aquae]GGB37226.1 hypothetical protein GCM10011316_06660 [Roseibium aquae]